ncbi:hypothetical protein HX866_27145 [Pseudomonas gingeri]|uniref:FitA-like ribbon-helix-helix domain-containing protein n=1 Tax=Pseudomonas gingeri TaxID=117681 RepID=UPI0015A2CF8B|nr:hypothetical protein [Pseudomonas gingeri]NWA28570.1 hypothetical protein [Pseudomonas gingeri]
MARISIRDLPDDLHYKLQEAAASHERSLESEIRFALKQYIHSFSKPAPEQLSLREAWQRQVGQRLKFLFERLREDGVFAWGEHSDTPHLALRLDEPSPSLLMDCIDGLSALTFALAEKITQQFGCSLEWLLSGKGSMFPYPEIGNSYAEFFAPAIDHANTHIKLVRVCQEEAGGSSGRHDGTLIMFRVEKGKHSIAAGFSSTRFYLGSGMGATGHGNLETFVKFINQHPGIRYEAHNFCGELDETGMWEHHPSYYLNGLEHAQWLRPLLDGTSPSSIKWQD